MTVYNKKKWQTKRKVILKRDDYLCQECKRYGKRVDAEHVHHIVPIDERPDLELDGDNLISLCRKCHNEMHDRNTGQLTEVGQGLRYRRFNTLLK